LRGLSRKGGSNVGTRRLAFISIDCPPTSNVSTKVRKLACASFDELREDKLLGEHTLRV